MEVLIVFQTSSLSSCKWIARMLLKPLEFIYTSSRKLFNKGLEKLKEHKSKTENSVTTNYLSVRVSCSFSMKRLFIWQDRFLLTFSWFNKWLIGIYGLIQNTLYFFNYGLTNEIHVHQRDKENKSESFK